MGFDRRQKPKHDKQRILTILFGILTGFILFVVFDMPEDVETESEEFENIRDSRMDTPEYDFKTSKNARKSHENKYTDEFNFALHPFQTAS